MFLLNIHLISARFDRGFRSLLSFILLLLFSDFSLGCWQNEQTTSTQTITCELRGTIQLPKYLGNYMISADFDGDARDELIFIRSRELTMFSVEYTGPSGSLVTGRTWRVESGDGPFTYIDSKQNSGFPKGLGVWDLPRGESFIPNKGYLTLFFDAASSEAHRVFRLDWNSAIPTKLVAAPSGRGARLILGALVQSTPNSESHDAASGVALLELSKNGLKQKNHIKLGWGDWDFLFPSPRNKIEEILIAVGPDQFGDSLMVVTYDIETAKPLFRSTYAVVPAKPILLQAKYQDSILTLCSVGLDLFQLQIMKGGRIAFDKNSIHEFSSIPKDMIAADIDGDGRQELIVSYFGGYEVPLEIYNLKEIN